MAKTNKVASAAKGPFSPLRYPGGKGKLAPCLEGIFRKLPDVRAFAETHAGGAGMGLHFLFKGRVQRLLLNDLDARIFAFWKSAVTDSGKFAEAVRSARLDMDEWHRQRGIYLDGRGGDFEQGFSAFYLNRTNHGGVLGGRPIGGLDQKGRYKLDARFNRAGLAERLAAIGERSRSISVSNLEAAGFLGRIGPDTLVFLDPPYLDKDRLYGDFPDTTQQLSDALRGARFPWIMTINDGAETRERFRWARMRPFRLRYSFRTALKSGSELLIWGNIDDGAFDFGQKIFAEAA